MLEGSNGNCSLASALAQIIDRTRPKCQRYGFLFLIEEAMLKRKRRRSARFASPHQRAKGGYGERQKL
jgi:hypothetical protein